MPSAVLARLQSTYFISEPTGMLSGLGSTEGSHEGMQVSGDVRGGGHEGKGDSGDCASGALCGQILLEG